MCVPVTEMPISDKAAATASLEYNRCRRGLITVMNRWSSFSARPGIPSSPTADASNRLPARTSSTCVTKHPISELQAEISGRQITRAQTFRRCGRG